MADMVEYRLHLRADYNCPDILIPTNNLASPMAEWLLAYFKLRVDDGVRFFSGETVQVGWGLLMLKLDSAGDLEVWEPEFQKFPIQWVPGASASLRILHIHKQICDLFGVEAEFPSLRDAGLTSSQFLTCFDGFQMYRDPPEHNDSGWGFQCLNEQVVDAQYNSLFEIALGRAAVVPFLALPPGSLILWSASELRVNSGRTTLLSQSNQLLATLFQSGFTL